MNLVQALKTARRYIRGFSSVVSTARFALFPGRAAKYDRLHVGCGPVHIGGFLNIDAQPNPAVDLVCDLRRLDRRYPAGRARLIYACHVLEHLGHAEAREMLGMFHRLLAPGGEIRISVPDMDRIVRIYSKNWEHFQADGNSPWIGLIWGGQTDPHDFHKTGFNFNWMRHLLAEAGFRDVEEYPHEPHFLGVSDGSLAKEPFGEFVSLNVRAFK